VREYALVPDRATRRQIRHPYREHLVHPDAIQDAPGRVRAATYFVSLTMCRFAVTTIDGDAA
jgi:hypothetical protein